MKTIEIWILIITLSSISCKKELENVPDSLAIKSDLDKGMPGFAIADMKLDINNNFYFVTWKSDYTIEHTGSSLPFRYYLSRKTAEKSTFEILDSNFVQIDKMIFDKNNNLWAINYHGLYLRKNNKCDPIIKLNIDNSEGIFTSMAVDSDNNIWVGGMQTGIYKIDTFLKITKYTTTNSVLTSNSMECIHVDVNNNIWIAMYAPNGVLKINKDKWIVYGSPGQISQAIWSIVIDKNSNLWIGEGWPDKDVSLIRFIGDVWEKIYPKNDKDEMVTGVIRQLYSDKNKIYVVIESNEEPTSNQLLTFDGATWNKIYGLPDTDLKNPIMDLEIDYFRHIAWINIYNQGIYKLKI